MAINQSYPVLDGIAPSWADFSCNLTIPGAPILKTEDVKSFSTGTSVEVGEQRGASGGRVIKRTTGSAKDEASVVLYYSGFVKMMRALMAVAPRRGNQAAVSLVHFGWQLIWTPPGSDEIFETRVKGCRYLGRTNAPAEGNDAQTVDVKLNPIQIVDMIDGIEVVCL